jgi:dethiobiotin synthetase
MTARPDARHSYFVTGTDTGVGKTLVACALLHAFASTGLRVVGMKPVAAGAVPSAEGLLNDDVSALRAASTIEVPLPLANPYCFEAPVAPHIAASLAGVEIDLARLESCFDALAVRADCVIVEGVGGFRVPLGRDVDAAQLARKLSLPVILVVGMRLGCLNHALLTAGAVTDSGLHLAGWVANHIDPQMACPDENVAALCERLEAPMLARIPYHSRHDAARLAPLVAIDALR